MAKAGFSVSSGGILANRTPLRSFGMVFCLAGVWLGSMSVGLAGTFYSITDLGDLGGVFENEPGFARARAINEHGQVAGEALLPVMAIIDRAVLWQSGSILDLGTLGGQQSAAFAINSSGTVGGWAQTAAGGAGPALWNGGVATALPTLGGTLGTVWGINNAGAAVGHSYLASGPHHAAHWSGSGVRDLGTLGGPYSVAYDINNRGDIVGSANDSAGRERASLWGDGGAVDLGGLSGGNWTAARAVNDSGQMIFWGTPLGADQNRAAFWDGLASSSVIELGTFGGDESWAYGLNNNGFVVGWAENTNSTYHAFVWDGTEKTDLGTLGGFYSAAYGINDQGTIVGFSTDAFGFTHAVAWNPVPEPSMLLLILLGGGWLGLRNRK